MCRLRNSLSESLRQLSQHLSAAAALVDDVSTELRRAQLRQRAEQSRLRVVQQAESTDSEHYCVLGLPDGADPDAVRSAYRRLSRAWHPDRPNGSREAFERIRAAADALLQS